MLGLAAVAALATMAFVAATSASANVIDFCLTTAKVKELTKAECDKVKGVIDSKSEKIHWKAKATNPELKGTLTETCEKSDALGYILAGLESGKTGTFVVETLSFTGSCSPCTTVTVNGLPYTGDIKMDPAGTYLAESPGSATISGGFFCFGNVCRFGTTSASLELVSTEEDTVNKFVAEEPLTVESGGVFCGTTGTWKATYTVETGLPSGFFFLL